MVNRHTPAQAQPGIQQQQDGEHGSLLVGLCTVIGFFVVGELLMVSLIGRLFTTPSWAVSLMGAAAISLMPFPVLYVIGRRQLAAHAAAHECDAYELKMNERRLMHAQLIAGFGSYELDLSTNRWISSNALDGILGINDRFDRSLAGWFSVIHPDWQDRVARLHRDVVRGACASFDLEYEIIRESDGQPRWVHSLAHVELDRQNRPVKMLGTVHDTTNRRRTDAALRLRGEALDAAAHAIIIADRHGTIEWVNKALTASTGYESFEVIGRNPRDLFKSGAQDATFYKALWSTLMTGGVWRGEMVNRRKDGSLFTEDVAITPVKNDRGVPTHFIAVKQDITERKRLEQLLRTQRLETMSGSSLAVSHTI